MFSCFPNQQCEVKWDSETLNLLTLQFLQALKRRSHLILQQTLCVFDSYPALSYFQVNISADVWRSIGARAFSNPQKFAERNQNHYWPFSEQACAKNVIQKGVRANCWVQL
jgi:hypothetical protein